MKNMRKWTVLLLVGALLAVGCAAGAEARANGVVVDATMNAVVVELAPYPSEAAEGWGARMHAVIATMELL